MRHFGSAISSVFLLVSGVALADIPPAPEPPVPIPPAPVLTEAPGATGEQKYSVAFHEDLSATILEAVAFQSSTSVKISNNTGSCSVTESTWEEGQRALVCRSSSSCQETVPSCVWTFPADAGLGVNDLLTIVGETPEPASGSGS